METFFFWSAWPMVPPAPYSVFHICFSFAGIAVSFFAARFAASRIKDIYAPWILFFCGASLALFECYKQGFLYFVVNSRRFDWWYFPFQLCSVPMYLCLAYPFLSDPQIRKILASFIQDFGLLGGIMALFEPSGLMHPFWTLTIHGFLWHFLLIFLGLYCCMEHLSGSSSKSFRQTLPLFFCCCLLATGINVAAGPKGNADMFYISPYYPSLQIIFHSIALQLGILPGHAIYLFSICLGAWLIHLACCRLQASVHRELRSL